jgi:hypothetical protein
MEKPTLEDLLKLKCHEKPSPEFWKGFDRELREKTLKMVVHQQRWNIFEVLRAARQCLAPAFPVAAAALVAIAFLVPSDNFQSAYTPAPDILEPAFAAQSPRFVSDSVHSSQSTFASGGHYVQSSAGSSVCFAVHSLGGASSMNEGATVVSAIL